MQVGYPRFIAMKFMAGDYTATTRRDTIPAMQNNMGIISHLTHQQSTNGRKNTGHAGVDFVIWVREQRGNTFKKSES